jgi:hypothetical protein
MIKDKYFDTEAALTMIAHIIINRKATLELSSNRVINMVIIHRSKNAKHTMELERRFLKDKENITS